MCTCVFFTWQINSAAAAALVPGLNHKTLSREIYASRGDLLAASDIMCSMAHQPVSSVRLSRSGIVSTEEDVGACVFFTIK